MIRDQNDHLFPSLVSLSRWYENQLIVNTSYIKALIVHFGIKEIDLATLGRSGLFQLYVTGLQMPNQALPHRIVFEIKQETGASIPITKMEQDRRLKAVDEPIEEPIEDGFDYDKKMTKEEIAELSVLNLPKQKSFEQNKKPDDKKRLSISALSDFYESKLDIMGKISKSILLNAKCGRLELDWERAIEKTQNSQLHLNYHLSEDKIIEKIELRLSEGHGPTTYGFVSKQESGSHLSLVQ